MGVIFYFGVNSETKWGNQDSSASEFFLPFISVSIYKTKWKMSAEPQETDPTVCPIFGILERDG